jgi:hypothetical protein
MLNVRPFSTPMKVGLKLEKRSTPSDSDTLREYQQMLGSLMYAVTGTRADLAYTATYLAQFASAPGPEHLEAMKYTFHYLAGTSHLALVFDGSSKLELYGYVDSDWAGDPNDRRSITGYAFKLGNCLVSWSSRKQPTVALSSTEGEYMAGTEASREAIFLRRVLTDIEFEFHDPTSLLMDNQSAMQIALNTSAAFSNRTKHIDVRHHWIRERIRDGVIKLEWIPTDDQAADILTKALPTANVVKFRTEIGIKSLRSR